MPGQGPAPMPRGLDRESLEALWDLGLAPMEPLLRTLVRKAVSIHTAPATNNINKTTAFYLQYL